MISLLKNTIFFIMRITILSPYFPYPKRGKFYGVERYTENLAISLKNLGNDIKIVTTYWNGGKRYDNYKGIQILRVLDTGTIFKEENSLFPTCLEPIINIISLLDISFRILVNIFLLYICTQSVMYVRKF